MTFKEYLNEAAATKIKYMLNSQGFKVNTVENIIGKIGKNLVVTQPKPGPVYHIVATDIKDGCKWPMVYTWSETSGLITRGSGDLWARADYPKARTYDKEEAFEFIKNNYEDYKPGKRGPASCSI